MNRASVISGILGLVIGAGTVLLLQSATTESNPDSANKNGASSPHGGPGGYAGSPTRPTKGSRRASTAERSEKQAVTRLHQSFLISNARSRRIETSRYFSQMTPENALEMRNLFLEFDKQGLRFDQEWGLLWHQWGKVDPLRALQQVDEEKEKAYPGFATQITGVIFSSWSEDDPAAAKAYIDKIEDDQQFNAAVNGIISGLTMAEAIDFAESIEFGDPRLAAKTAGVIADRALREAGDTAAIEDWFSGIRNEELRQAARIPVFRKLMNKSPGLAAGWVRDRTQDGMQTDGMIRELVTSYKRKNSLDGLDWYLSLPRETRNKSQFDQLMESARTEGDAFEKWSAENREQIDAVSREFGKE